MKIVLVRTANTSLQIEEAESVLPYILYWNNNTVHIESSYPIESLSCFNITGHTLYENQDHVYSLDIPQNPEGCYIVSFTINGHTYRTSYIQAARWLLIL